MAKTKLKSMKHVPASKLVGLPFPGATGKSKLRKAFEGLPPHKEQFKGAPADLLATLDAIPPATPKQVRDASLYDWRDPIMHNLQTDLAVQRKIIDDLRRQEALLRTELQHKNIFIDLLLKEREKS